MMLLVVQTQYYILRCYGEGQKKILITLGRAMLFKKTPHPLPTPVICVQSLNLNVDDYFQNGPVFAASPDPYTGQTLVLFDVQWEFISSTHARVER